MITKELIKSLFNYNQHTGEFIRIKKTARRTKIGEVAGWITNYGYRAVSVDSKKYLIHRLIFVYMTGEMPSHQVDHINHDRLDNRWRNLRAVTHKQNGRNKKDLKTNNAGHLGISILPNGKFRAKIGREHIGCFSSLVSAVIARKKAEKRLGYHFNHGL